MSNIIKVLNSLLNDDKHDLCDNGFEYTGSTCDKCIEYIFCSNCPLCSAIPNEYSIKMVRIKYSE